MRNRTNALISMAINSAEGVRNKARQWTAEDDEFLRVNLGYMTEAEMARKLGRSVTGVHLRWERDLGLPAPSKAPGIYTAQRMAKVLGVDAHKIAHWVDVGFIKGRKMAGGRKIRLIEEKDFLEWVMNPESWMYFDINRVQDADLKKKLKAAAKKWGDEWWTTPRVARYHRVTVGDVKRYIHNRWIRATQIKYSYGDRHFGRTWAYWFVKKSEATSKDLVFIVRRGGRLIPSRRPA